jgi:spore coat protein H
MGRSRIRFTMLAALLGSAAGCSGNPGPSGPADETERVFDTSVLHEIRIEVDPEYLPALEYDHTRRIPCRFTFDGVELEHVAIRQKGAGTHAGSVYTKPSLSVRFDELVRGQKLHGLDKLILNNAAADPTLVHEHLGYDLYQRAGVPSRRTAHAVVTLSGLRTGDQIYGVYVMVEAVDEDLLARHFGEPHDDGNLFEDEDAPDFASDPLAIDLKDDDEPGRSHQRLVEFADFLNNASEDELAERLDEFIDLELALRGFAVDLIAQHGDGFWLSSHNYYLYEHPVDHRFVMLPHGMDLAFDPIGRVCGTVPDPIELPTVLGERIARNPALRERLDQAMAHVLDEVWDVEHMVARIDALSELLEASSHTEPAFVAERDAHLVARDALKALLRDTEEVWRATTSSTCGDGARTGNELCASMCDDGNLVAGDGCSAECVLEFCGDWVIQPDLGEVCEDEPGCSWDCRAVVVCGDGVWDETELCDDGNLDDGDQCNNHCMPNCTQESRGGDVFAFCPYPAPHELTRDLCGSLHATPALPRSDEENQWLAARAGEVAAGSWWMGLDSYAGEWWAADGRPVTWLGWGAGEPDEPGDQACVIVDADEQGVWEDRPCHEAHPFVCKMF